MKILLCLLAAGGLWAQPGRGPAPVRSPEVAADGKVTFRLRAPNAKEVAVTGIGQRLAMKKDEQGVWTRDHRRARSPTSTPTRSASTARASTIRRNGSSRPLHGLRAQPVRGARRRAWMPANGPARRDRRITSTSPALIGDERDYFVYTPPELRRQPQEAVPGPLPPPRARRRRRALDERRRRRT